MRAGLFGLMYGVLLGGRGDIAYLSLSRNIAMRLDKTKRSRWMTLFKLGMAILLVSHESTH